MSKLIWTTPSVYRMVKEMFPPEQRQQVLAELSNYGGWASARDIIESLFGGRAMIQYAILVNSRGDKEAVEHWVEEAKQDFRDVLLAADMARNTYFPFW